MYYINGMSWPSLLIVYQLYDYAGFSLKRSRAAPRRTIECENGRGSNIYLLLKAAAMVLECI